MLTRREVVIEKPFQDRRFLDHRRKVCSALPRIDAGPPQRFPHLDVKMKKLRIEKDRQNKICEDNIRLIHRLAIIMRTKRMEDINNSPKGPFETKRKVEQKQKQIVTSPEIKSPKESSFLERITQEAMRRASPITERQYIQHRAPYGICLVPALKSGLATGTRRSYSSKDLKKIYSIQTGNPKRKLEKAQNVSESNSFPFVEVQNKSVQISLTYQNSDSFFTTNTSFNGRKTLDEIEDFEEEYTEIAEEEQPQTVSETAETKKESDDTESSEAADGSAISCSGFTETEENGSEASCKNGVARDSDEQVKSVLLTKTPNITVDEASDDDFYN
ncbi:UNVERIFIED_CONTAM: hypothetical protein RMT77_000447 [Armadillidium vulgare]